MRFLLCCSARSQYHKCSEIQTLIVDISTNACFGNLGEPDRSQSTGSAPNPAGDKSLEPRLEDLQLSPVPPYNRLHLRRQQPKFFGSSLQKRTLLLTYFRAKALRLPNAVNAPLNVSPTIDILPSDVMTVRFGSCIFEAATPTCPSGAILARHRNSDPKLSRGGRGGGLRLPRLTTPGLSLPQ